MHYLETPANPDWEYKYVIGFLWHQVSLIPHYPQFILMSPEFPDLFMSLPLTTALHLSHISISSPLNSTSSSAPYEVVMTIW